MTHRRNNFGQMLSLRVICNFHHLVALNLPLRNKSLRANLNTSLTYTTKSDIQSGLHWVYPYPYTSARPKIVRIRVQHTDKGTRLHRRLGL